MRRGAAGEEGRGRADLRPFAVTFLAALSATALLALSVRHGWLGPDVGRGAEFCERWHDGCLKQPVNTVSNLGFVLVGLFAAWRARWVAGRGDGLLARTAVVTTLTTVIALLGPASAAMHATGTELGGSLDLLSMHLIAAFAAAYAVSRRWGGHVALWFAALLALAQSAVLVPGEIPVVRHPENVTFVLLILLTLVVESGAPSARARSSRETHSDARWLGAAIGTLAIAFGIWNLAQGPWCDPDSWVQGHGAWHILCALSCWFLFCFYTSERRWAPPNPTGIGCA